MTGDHEFISWIVAENFVHAENKRLGRVLSQSDLEDDIRREAGLLKRSLKILADAGYEVKNRQERKA